MSLPDPVLPPLLTGHPVMAPRRPFEVAVEGAETGALGAADLVWARDTSRFDCALVLEPDVDRIRAAEALFVAMVAFGDSFGAIAPPEIALTYRWPMMLCVNGARAGTMRAAISADDGPDGCPRWMVLGLCVDIRRDRRAAEPGLAPDVTDLVEEGCGELNRTELIESYSRHLLTWIHSWQVDGFGPVHELLLFRSEGYREAVSLEHGGTIVTGRFAGLDDHGNLILETGQGIRLLDVAEAFETVKSVRETA
jgi:BirA family transcriptional regulator, biotin operon repressor / biotin---[acetyl-CoA-carboxylase] ligase